MRPRRLQTATKDDLPTVMRASVTFPAELYLALEQIARLKKVSVAWVVRDATDRYVADERKRVVGRGTAR